MDDPTPLKVRTAPVKLDSVTFDQLLARQDPVERGVFDLDGVTFIAPSGLVSLAVAIEAACDRAHEVVVRVGDLALRTYLARCGFLPLMEPYCEVTPDVGELAHMYDHRQGRNPVVIELTRLNSFDELPPLLDRAIETLGLVRANVYDAYDVAALLSELAGNVLEHGGGTGYLAMQAYGSGKTRFLELAIGDGGPGIRQSLHANPTLPRMADDLHAIIAAIRTGVSSSQEPTRGTGLHQMLRIVIGHGGSAQIRTGSAKVRWRADRPRGFGFVVPHLGGTQVTFSIPAT